MDLQTPSRMDARLRQASLEAMTTQAACLAQTYERAPALARLRAPARLETAQEKQVLRWLKKALRNERSKALTGHWSYDANRHLMLKAALKRELAGKAHGSGPSGADAKTPPTGQP